MSINETSLANLSWINTLEPRKYVWFYLMFIFVILITIIGNTLVVLAVLKNRNLQNTTNYFLMSLAIADCLVALIVWPLSVITEILGYFPFGFVVCNFWVTSDILLCTSSIWHMCVMSIDRFCTIKFPLKYGRNKTRKFLFWKIATVWLISTAISSPMLVLGFVNESFVYVESNRSCSPNHSEFRLFGSILAFCIPFLIITVTYSFTMKALKRLMQKKEITRLIGDKDIDEENTLVVSAVASTARNGSIFNRDSITPHHDKLYGVRKSFRKFTPCSFRRTSSQDRHRPSRVELLNNLNSPNSIRLCSMLDNQPALKSIKSDSKNHKYSIFSSMITTNSSIGESRHKIMIPSNIRDTNIQLDYNQNNIFFPNNNHNVDKNDNHTKVNSLDKLFISEQSETKVKCDNEPAIEQRNDDEFGRLDHNTLHLSLPKLNFSMEKNKSDSNLNRSFKTRGRLFGAGSSAGSRRKNNYNLIFELNDSSVHRSNSSLVELTGFEKSKYRLKRMQKLKNALFGIEREMDKLLNVGQQQQLNDQQQAQQSNVTVKPINNKKHPTKTTSPSASIISTTTPATRIKKSITTPKTMNKPSKQPKKAKKSQSNANEKSKCQIKQNLVERRETQRPSENIESNISSLICDGDSSSLLNFKWKIANIMFKSSRAESTSQANGTRQQSPTKKATTYDTFVTRVSDDGKNAEFSPYKRESYRHILCKQISYPNSKTSSDCILRNSSFFVSGSNYIKNVPRLALKSNKANNERKALRVLIIIFSIFVLFWSPFFVVNLVSIYCVEMCKFITNELILAITWLGYASSTLNPIIYTMFNKSFRNAFINLLKCRTIPQKELRRDRFLVYKNTAAYSHLNKNIKS